MILKENYKLRSEHIYAYIYHGRQYIPSKAHMLHDSHSVVTLHMQQQIFSFLTIPSYRSVYLMEYL